MSTTVIAHRGASGDRPEHTLEAYRLAIELGADVIEPDLVITKDGVLIARHEPMLGGTTDVADHPEFADRLTTKVIEGETVTDWFAEDFTLAEIKTLRAKERIPAIRPDNAAFDGQFEIPTLAEVIDLVKEVEAETGRKIGIIPEIKHPTYFEYAGHYIDGTPINVDTSQLLIDTLVAEGFTDPARVTIQSFEIANLIELQTKIMPEAGIDLPLVQLLFFDYAPDVAFHFNPANPDADPSLYDGFSFPLTQTTVPVQGGGGLYSAEAFQAMAALYAEAVSVLKEDVYLQSPITPAVDFDGDGVAQIGTQLNGTIVPIVQWAHDAGLDVVVYTMRNEEPFLTLNADGSVQRPVEEFVKIVSAGFDAMFTDHSLTGREVVDQLAAGDGAIAATTEAGGKDILVLDAAALSAAKGSAGLDTAIYGGSGVLDLARNIEDAELRGDAGAEVSGNALANRVAGRDGDDLVRGRDGDDILAGGNGEDALSGGDGADSLSGGDGADTLRGRDGADVLDGSAGDDRLRAGGGQDSLTGGLGADSFVFDDVATAGDTILDFAAGDRIVVSTAGFGGGLVLGLLDSARFAEIAGAPVATTPAGTGQFLFDAASGELWYDVDGAGATAAALVAELSGGVTLAASDIRVIA